MPQTKDVHPTSQPGGCEEWPLVILVASLARPHACIGILLTAAWNRTSPPNQGGLLSFISHHSLFLLLSYPIILLPLSRNIRSRRVQTQETIVRGNDFYTPHFTLPTNSPTTHQPHSILSYPSRTLYFGTKFEHSRTLYFGTEGVHTNAMAFNMPHGPWWICRVG
jgi:hypothetical protein